MDEIKIIFKNFVITAIIVLLLQVHVAGLTIENRVENFLQKSGVAVYVQGIAAGGALAISNFSASIKQGVMSSWEGFRQGSEQQEQHSRAQK